MFPLDEGAAVCGFEALIDGTLVVGEVKERETAFAKYDDAMQAGHGAILLDEERPDVFQASVGNLPPGKEALLKITYVSELDVQGGALRFVVPTTVSPRYAPAADRVGVGRPDAETLNPPRDWRVPYGLESRGEPVDVRLDRRASSRRRIRSRVADERTAGDGDVVAAEAALDRDFVLIGRRRRARRRRARGSRGTTTAPTPSRSSFVPSLRPTARAGGGHLPRRSIGLDAGHVDRQVRNALQLCLRSMIPGCRFNIVGFGSTSRRCSQEPRSMTRRAWPRPAHTSRTCHADWAARRSCRRSAASLLERPSANRSRQVVVLTDGQVTQHGRRARAGDGARAAPRASSRSASAPARASISSTGSRARAADRRVHLPGRADRAEGGAAVRDGCCRRRSPTSTVDWGGLERDAGALRAPPVFAGGRLLLYGFVTRLKCRPPSVRLTASSTPVHWRSRSRSIPCNDAGRTVATLAARARIRELEESPEGALRRGSHQARKETSQRRRSSD